MTRQSEWRSQVGLTARLSAAAAVLVVAAIPLALVLLRLLHHGRLAGLDGRIARRLAGAAFHSPRAAMVANEVTHLGDAIVLATVVIGAALTLLLLHRRHQAVFLLITVSTGVLVDLLLKAVVLKARSAFVAPVASGLNKSFPSGHAMNSVFVYGALVVIIVPLLKPSARWVAAAGTIALVAVISASRVALGMHYISDVVAGVIFGVAWLGACVWAFSRWRVETSAASG